MKIIHYISGMLLCLSSVTCTTTGKTAASSDEETLYRPNYHFTPASAWMNDPNGMFYLDGTYHLFYQHYPDESKWGPMHWGHAVSEDLVTWSHRPIALYPDELGYVFSGSAVVDVKNTSGFGNGSTPPVVAIFTSHSMEKEKNQAIDVETQSIAYSIDKGATWVKYSGNPVLPNPGIRDFRDPKVFWHEGLNQWVMALAAQDRIQFYASKDLKKWDYLSEFGKTLGAHGGVWECPDLFPLRVNRSGEQKWVLLVSINPGGPNTGSATQYFVGDFNGKEFRLDQDFKKQLDQYGALWMDYGKDNYAGVTFSNTGEEKILMGWMSNWDYAQDVPTKGWRSATTIPRKLSLHKENGTYSLGSYPIANISKITGKAERKQIAGKSQANLLAGRDLNLSSAMLEIELDGLKKEIYQFELKNTSGETLKFGINNIAHTLFIDRSASGLKAFGRSFAEKTSTAPLYQQRNNARLTVLLDKTSIEIFLDGGKTVMTEIFFPTTPYTDFSVSAAQPFNVDITASEITSKKTR